MFTTPEYKYTKKQNFNSYHTKILVKADVLKYS